MWISKNLFNNTTLIYFGMTLRPLFPLSFFLLFLLPPSSLPLFFPLPFLLSFLPSCLSAFFLLRISSLSFVFISLKMKLNGKCGFHWLGLVLSNVITSQGSVRLIRRLPYFIQLLSLLYHLHMLRAATCFTTLKALNMMIHHILILDIF